MKNPVTVVAYVLCLALPAVVSADDIIDGWSGEATISDAFSDNTATWFTLSGVASGCGDATQWKLPKLDAAVSVEKHSVLVSAELYGKRVNLRCENSRVTDFFVVN